MNDFSVEQAQAFLAAIVESSDDAIVGKSLDGIILTWNRAAERLFGYTAEEAVGRPISLLVPPERPNEMPSILSAVRRGERLDHFETERIAKDGRRLQVSLSVSPIRDAEGRVVGAAKIARDITRRKWAERALAESEARFRQLAEAIGSVFFLVEGFTQSPPGKTLYVSPAYERIWGRPPAELYRDSQAWLYSIHPEDRPRVEGELSRARSGDFDIEFRILRPDGEVRWIRDRVFPVQPLSSEPPAPDRLVGIAEDITDQKNAEITLRERNEELRSANTRAEAANAAKDHFLATLSHELRTPLTPVLAITSSLEDDDRLPADVREALSRVRRNVELEARLIDDLLDLTRIARGKLELHREVVDLAEILDHALLTCCTEEVTSGRLAVTTGLAAGDHRLWADAPRLTQVFWNLLNNAIKFTPEGGRIDVRSTVEPSAPERYLAVQVEDSGIGIEPEVLPRIFDGFEQGERTITRRFGGLGLGLAVSKAIVEMHGGELTAESRGRDRGATFTVRLPVGQLPASTAERSLADLAPLPPREERPLHILLVEDHADTAAALAELLSGLGHRVSVAGSVGEGLATAAAAEPGNGIGGGEGGSGGEGGKRIDVVVSDLGLPDGSGLDLMRELASRYGLRGIALSGYGMEEDVQKSRAAGFDLHLTKPVKLQALVAAIQQTAG